MKATDHDEKSNDYKMLSIRGNLTQLLDQEGLTLEEKDLLRDTLDLVGALTLPKSVTTRPNDHAIASGKRITDRGQHIAAFHDGLTKREYFAAMAMQGFLSNAYYYHSIILSANEETRDGAERYHLVHETIANTSVELADAFIKALNPPTKIPGSAAIAPGIHEHFDKDGEELR